ncbi:UNVERIFIED_CONTAM: hypothetical protein NCL1_33632 [Trichonephila clavipes]
MNIEELIRADMARSVVALFIVSFLFSTLSAFPGLVGCWRRSHSNIIATGLLQLLAGKKKILSILPFYKIKKSMTQQVQLCR